MDYEAQTGVGMGMNPSQGTENELAAAAQSIPENEWGRLRAELARLPADQRNDYILNFARDYRGAAGDASDDMARADAIRREEGPQGRRVGGVYQAANPLQHLASGMQKYKANQDFKKAKTARGEARTNSEGLRGDLMKTLADY